MSELYIYESESKDTETLINQTLINQTLINQTLINQPLINQTLINQTLINQTLINQIFKTNFPIDKLWEYLQTNYEDKDTHFIITKFLYKKTEYNNNLDTFIDSLKEYYYVSKRKYVNRKMTYKNFLTIIRQLCNSHNIIHTSKLVYDKSSYEIEYSIYK